MVVALCIGVWFVAGFALAVLFGLAVRRANEGAENCHTSPLRLVEVGPACANTRPVVPPTQEAEHG